MHHIFPSSLMKDEIIARELEHNLVGFLSKLFLYLFSIYFFRYQDYHNRQGGYITFPPARVLACKSSFSNRRFIVFILAISDQGSLNDDLKTGEWR